MTFPFIRTAAALGTVLSLCCGLAQAQVAVTFNGNTGFRYTQDFNQLAAAPGTYRWYDNQTLPGWFLFNFVEQELVTPTYRVNNGDSASGSFFSYGLGSESDRALGAVGSGGAYFGTPAAGTNAGFMALALRNTTGQPLTRLSLQYTGQQWRQGASDDVNTLVLQYGLGETVADVQTWVAPGTAFNFDSPSHELVTDTGTALNGRAAAASLVRGGSLNVAWAPNAVLWVRWVFKNNHGYDHGLAIDDVVVTVPTP